MYARFVCSFLLMGLRFASWCVEVERSETAGKAASRLVGINHEPS